MIEIAKKLQTGEIKLNKGKKRKKESFTRVQKSPILE
jgi:hypothetical protein